MSNIEEVGGSLSGIMHTVREADSRVQQDEQEYADDRDLIKKITASLGEVMAAASELKERYADHAKTIAEPRRTMQDVYRNLKGRGIAPEAEQKALGYFAAAEGRGRAVEPDGMRGLQVSVWTMYQSLQVVEEHLQPTVEVVNEAARRAEMIPGQLETIHANSVLGCEAVTDYARQAGIPVANPYE